MKLTLGPFSSVCILDLMLKRRALDILLFWETVETAMGTRRTDSSLRRTSPGRRRDSWSSSESSESHVNHPKSLRQEELLVWERDIESYGRCNWRALTSIRLPVAIMTLRAPAVSSGETAPACARKDSEISSSYGAAKNDRSFQYKPQPVGHIVQRR